MFEVSTRKMTHNIANVLYGRQSSGPLFRRQAVQTSFYSKVGLLRQTLGHLSAVYCVLFDRTGKYIVTVSFQCFWQVHNLSLKFHGFRAPMICL